LQWDEFRDNLKAYVDKHGKIPNSLNDKEFLENGGKELHFRLMYYQKQPKAILGEYKHPHVKEFKREHGHTFITAHNSSEDIYDWVVEQRKRMVQFAKTPTRTKDKPLYDYQAEMLSRIGFVYARSDIEWMEQYERLAAFKRLFGCVAVTDKFVSFEVLQQVMSTVQRSAYFFLSFSVLKAKLSVSPSGSTTIKGCTWTCLSYLKMRQLHGPGQLE